MSKKPMKFSSQRSVPGLSIPNAGGIWKNIASGQEYVVMSKGIGMILIRERGNEAGEPIRLTDLMGFYREFRYIGKE